jgi:hypothetical protein
MVPTLFICLPFCSQPPIGTFATFGTRRLAVFLRPRPGWAGALSDSTGARDESGLWGLHRVPRYGLAKLPGRLDAIP